MTLPARVTVYEVGPRDGLQNVPDSIPTDAKVAFNTSLASGCFWSSLRAIATRKVAFVLGISRCGLFGSFVTRPPP